MTFMEENFAATTNVDGKARQTIARKLVDSGVLRDLST